jgi:D-3-phosphoglycerate dehydrogenase
LAEQKRKRTKTANGTAVAAAAAPAQATARPRILLAEPDDFSPRALSLLEEVAHVDRRACTRAQLHEAFGAYDAIWFRLGHRIDREVLSGPVRARVLATPVTGLDHIDLDACAERGIRVVSLRGEVDFLRRVRATAELTVGLALALLRRIPAAASSVHAGVWNRDAFRGRELYERTAGVVGLGRLGTIVAGMLRAMGMHVIGYDPRPDFPDGVVDRRCATLPELLAASDLVTLHVGYSPATRHLIGAAELAHMRADAILVNTSRGGIVDELALLAALERDRLDGAALDVLDGEPAIEADHPLVRFSRANPERLLIVPHIGGNTWESFEKTEIFLAGRVLEALAAAAPRAGASA